MKSILFLFAVIALAYLAPRVIEAIKSDSLARNYGMAPRKRILLALRTIFFL